jgi:glycosyltransferase involved in cell wall biosynthesis
MILFIGATPRKKRAMLGGGTVKNGTFIEYLSGKGVQVEVVDTADWRRRALPILASMFTKVIFKQPEVIITSVFNDSASRLYKLFEIMKIDRKAKLIHMPVGGNFAGYIESNRELIGRFAKTSMIFAQSSKQVEQLRSLGLNQAEEIKNFRLLKTSILPEKLPYPEVPLKAVFFSRVTKEKGIEDAVKAVNKINDISTQGPLVYLDVFGPIDPPYREVFAGLIEGNRYCKYKGILTPCNEQPQKTLSQYDFMVFPTFLDAEGFPGVIIDALSSGLPVVASRWNFNSEFIEDGKTGLLFEVKNVLDLQMKINSLINNANELYSMKLECLREARKYDAEVVLPNIVNRILNA